MNDSQTPQIGFIGLGAMGMGMAQSLVRAGLPVKAYDINPAALETFVQAGGQAASSCADAARDADVFVVMVVSAEQAEDVLFGSGNAVAHLPSGALVMLSSTVPPAYARETSARLLEMGLEMLDAPVSGGPLRAADGSLSVMASGSPGAFARCQKVLEAVAANVYNMGDACGLGSVMKSINQLLAGVHISAMAEAMTFGVKQGVDPAKIYQVICASAGASWMFENRAPHILENDYTPRSAIDIWVKDLGIVLAAGKENRLALPLAAAAHQLYLAAAAQGMGRLDDAAVVKVYAQLAGMEM